MWMAHRQNHRAWLRGLKSSWRTLDAENSGTTIRLLSESSATGLHLQDYRRCLAPKAPHEARRHPAAPNGRRNSRRVMAIFPRSKFAAVIFTASTTRCPWQRPGEVRRAAPGLYASGETLVTEPAKTRDHTELALELFGARVEKTRPHDRNSRHGGRPAKARLQSQSLDVPEISPRPFSSSPPHRCCPNRI